MSQLFPSGGQSIGVSALASVLPKNSQDFSPLEWTGWISLQSKGAFFAAQTVKHLPPVQETWFQSLDQEDTVEEGMATHSSILAWRIPWTEEPGGL